MIKSIQVEGIEELKADFRRFGKESDKAIKRAVDQTAEAIETDAKHKLINDSHIITGRLAASIHGEYKNGQRYNYKDNKGNSYDGSLNEKIGNLEAVAGTNVHYAPYIEFGTKYITGDSYLGHAALKQEKKFKDRVEKELNKLITEATK